MIGNYAFKCDQAGGTMYVGRTIKVGATKLNV